MGKVIDTTGRKIADTLGPAPTPKPQPRVEVPADKPRSIAPTGLATAAIVLTMLGGFGLLYAQNAETGGRAEVRMARTDKFGERIDGLTSKLDAIGTNLVEANSRLQAMSLKLDGFGNQVSAGLRDANRSLSETLTTSMNALSQRLAAQQQQPREPRSQQPPSSSSNAPRSYEPYPGAIQPRRMFPY
jgi:hypothetical protein